MKNLEFEDKLLIFEACLIIIGLICMFIILIFMSKRDDENYKKCLENHSVKYCEKNILGVY